MGIICPCKLCDFLDFLVEKNVMRPKLYFCSSILSIKFNQVLSNEWRRSRTVLSSLENVVSKIQDRVFV